MGWLAFISSMTDVATKLANNKVKNELVNVHWHLASQYLQWWAVKATWHRRGRGTVTLFFFGKHRGVSSPEPLHRCCCSVSTRPKPRGWIYQLGKYRYRLSSSKERQSTSKSDIWIRAQIHSSLHAFIQVPRGVELWSRGKYVLAFYLLFILMTNFNIRVLI